MLKVLAVSAVAALALVGLALAAPQKDTYNLTANLKARSEVPRPTAVPVGATGLFTGKAVELANDKAKLTWRLTFGKAGPVMVALCGPCRSGQRGTATLTHAQFAKIEAGATYVNVHTAKNAGGEIRGQVKVSEAG